MRDETIAGRPSLASVDTARCACAQQRCHSCLLALGQMTQYKHLDDLHSAARRVFGLDALVILVAESTGLCLTAVAGAGGADPLAAVRIPLGPDGGAPAHACRTRQTVLYDGTAPLPDALRLLPPYDRIEVFHAAAFAAVPLMIQGRAIGVLWAAWTVGGQCFDAITVEKLHLLAANVASLVNLRMQDEHHRHRAQELSLIREIDRMTLAEVPLHDILLRAVESFASLAGSKTCVLVTADPESGALTPAAIWGPDPAAIRRYFATLNPRVGEEGGSLGQAIATREPVVIPDIASSPQAEWYRDAISALGIRAVCSVPLLAGQQVPGAVGIGYPTARNFSEAEIYTMIGFARQLTMTWERARLRDDARERWRLEEANRIKAQFIANMSHELRTPLNSVIGFAELLQDAAFGPLTDKQRRYIGHIHESGKHLLALINDVLDLSKMEAGKIELHPESLCVSDALEAAVALMGDHNAKTRLALELQIEEGLPRIMADPVRLRQILFNLLSNAVKFTPDGGTVMVSASLGSRVSGNPCIQHPGDFVEITVADTGIGIKPEDLPRLFQEFVRLDATAARRIEGTGLGLALTKRLVELHGGTIEAASEGAGRGATFTVRLPVTGPAR